MMIRMKCTVLILLLICFFLTATDKPLLSHQELEILEYIQATSEIEAPDFNAWLFRFLYSLMRRIESLEFKMKHEQVIDPFLSPFATEILQVIYGKGKATMADIVHVTNAPRSTIKKYLNYLIDQKYIMRHGKGRAIWYTQV